MGFSFVLQYFFLCLLASKGYCSHGQGSQKLKTFAKGGSSYVWSYRSVAGIAQPSGYNGYDGSFPQYWALPPLPAVTVQCREAELLVTVNKDLFGIGQLVKEDDLTLGSEGCTPSSVNATTAVFQYELHHCGNTVMMTPDSLVYSTSLFYNPTPSDNPTIIRTNEAVVPIQCHYPRRNNVSSNAIKPTWIPFYSTVSSEQRLQFSLRLMSDDWTTERTSNVFLLGDVLNIEASVSTENQVPLRIFIDGCIATLQEDENTSPKYPVIDNYGCLMDSKSSDSSSAFISPRPQLNKLWFSLSAFRFFNDTRSMIYITCYLKAADATGSPNSTNKACTFIKPDHIWSPVEGSSDICDCCNTGNCGAFGSWKRSSFGRHVKRDTSNNENTVGSVHLTPVVILGIPAEEAVYSSERESLVQENTDGSRFEAIAYSVFALVGAAALGSAILYSCKKQRAKTES
ncbi:zona pellucida sperm-binding protein 3-like [Protopterus annectens]|uniref:zona pellucida sperm-binding protein 3-like n=1 Tax=Protopterus annectens TaxID=7888 RepID=UPI001CF97F7C|nr:zona pellucida sperm-binding protein 3-like [Protopterus annectens]